MRVALVSTGLGRVLRGFEAFTQSLHDAIRQEAPAAQVQLFKGGGRAAGAGKAVWNLHRADWPARLFGEHRASLLEKRSFALALYPHLRRGGYAVVHYNELAMGSALLHLRRWLGGNYRLLYCNGAPSPPVHFEARCDLAQLLHGPMMTEAIDYGLPPDRVTLQPYGVDGKRFTPANRQSREAVRHELNIPDDAFVVLCAAAIKREHKRIDSLIEEVARLGPADNAWLVVAGQRTADTPELERLAQARLPGRWRFVSWPFADMHRLYGAGDVFALTSTSEGFGLVIVEALLSGLPVCVHEGETFEWVARGSGARLVDMAQPGQLAEALRPWTEPGALESAARQAEACREHVAQRFAWEHLVPAYLEMYRQAAAAPPITS